MLANQEPDRNAQDRNIEDLSDEEIYSTIHYLERQCESIEKQNDGDGVAIPILLLTLLLGLLAFVWFYR